VGDAVTEVNLLDWKLLVAGLGAAIPTAARTASGDAAAPRSGNGVADGVGHLVCCAFALRHAFVVWMMMWLRSIFSTRKCSLLGAASYTAAGPADTTTRSASAGAASDGNGVAGMVGRLICCILALGAAAVAVVVDWVTFTIYSYNYTLLN
jgi:hypothetical protein